MATRSSIPPNGRNHHESGDGPCDADESAAKEQIPVDHAAERQYR